MTRTYAMLAAESQPKGLTHLDLAAEGRPRTRSQPTEERTERGADLFTPDRRCYEIPSCRKEAGEAGVLPSKRWTVLLERPLTSRR